MKFLQMQYDYQFKLIIIGDPATGKSCLVLQFTDSRFRQKHEVTIGVEFGTKTIQVEDKNIKCQIWDTAGQETFISITRSYFRSAAGCILVYDITNKESFDNIHRWLEEAKNHGNSMMTYILVGNKSDQEENRMVSYQEGLELAQKNNCMFLETSAKTGKNVQESFQLISKKIYQKILNKEFDLTSENCGVRTTLQQITQNSSVQLSIHLSQKSVDHSSCEC